MLYMATFTINIPPMLAYIPYMDPMGYQLLSIATLQQPASHENQVATSLQPMTSYAGAWYCVQHRHLQHNVERTRTRLPWLKVTKLSRHPFVPLIGG